MVANCRNVSELGKKMLKPDQPRRPTHLSLGPVEQTPAAALPQPDMETLLEKVSADCLRKAQGTFLLIHCLVGCPRSILVKTYVYKLNEKTEFWF